MFYSWPTHSDQLPAPATQPGTASIILPCRASLGLSWPHVPLLTLIQALSPHPHPGLGDAPQGLEAAGGRSSSHWVNKPTENRATVGLAPDQVQPLRQVCVGWGGSMGPVFTADRAWCLQSSSGSWGLSIEAGRGTPLSPRDGGSSPPPPKSRALLRRRIHSCGYIEQMGQDKGEPLEQVFPYQGHVQQR